MRNAIVVVMVLLGAGKAFAQSTSATTSAAPTANAAVPSANAPATAAGTSTASNESGVMKFLDDNLTLKYFGIFRGGSLTALGNANQPNYMGQLDPTQPQSLESYVTAGYKVDKDLAVGVITHFMYSPVDMPATGSPFQMLDPALMVSKANLVNVGGLNIKGILSAQLPMTSTDSLKPNGLLTAISPTANISYDFNSKWNLSLYTYITAYIPGSNAVDSYTSYKIYAAPNATYQFSEKVAATMWVDLVQITRASNTSFIQGMDNYPMDIEPGISWEFTKNFFFNPIINIYPKTPTLAASSVQAVISGKFF